MCQFTRQEQAAVTKPLDITYCLLPTEFNYYMPYTSTEAQSPTDWPTLQSLNRINLPMDITKLFATYSRARWNVQSYDEQGPRGTCGLVTPPKTDNTQHDSKRGKSSDHLPAHHRIANYHPGSQDPT